MRTMLAVPLYLLASSPAYASMNEMAVQDAWSLATVAPVAGGVLLVATYVAVQAGLLG